MLTDRETDGRTDGHTDRQTETERQTGVNNLLALTEVKLTLN